MPKTEHNVLDYVSTFCERLHHACQFAHENLAQAQTKMKRHYDKVCAKSFPTKWKVLVLLPFTGSRLKSQFSGLYMVEQKNQ